MRKGNNMAINYKRSNPSSEYASRIRSYNRWQQSMYDAHLRARTDTKGYLARRKQFHSMQACIQYLPSTILPKYGYALQEGSNWITFISYSTMCANVRRFDAASVKKQCVAERYCFPNPQPSQTTLTTFNCGWYEIELNPAMLNHSTTTSRQLVRFLNESCNTTDLTIGILRRLYNDKDKTGSSTIEVTAKDSTLSLIRHGIAPEIKCNMLHFHFIQKPASFFEVGW